VRPCAPSACTPVQRSPGLAPRLTCAPARCAVPAGSSRGAAAVRTTRSTTEGQARGLAPRVLGSEFDAAEKADGSSTCATCRSCRRRSAATGTQLRRWACACACCMGACMRVWVRACGPWRHAAWVLAGACACCACVHAACVHAARVCMLLGRCMGAAWAQHPGTNGPTEAWCHAPVCRLQERKRWYDPQACAARAAGVGAGDLPNSEERALYQASWRIRCMRIAKHNEVARNTVRSFAQRG
jgi:hypothetical protein